MERAEEEEARRQREEEARRQREAREAKEEAQAASTAKVGPIRSSDLDTRDASVLELKLPLESSLIEEH